MQFPVYVSWKSLHVLLQYAPNGQDTIYSSTPFYNNIFFLCRSYDGIHDQVEE